MIGPRSVWGPPQRPHGTVRTPVKHVENVRPRRLLRDGVGGEGAAKKNRIGPASVRLLPERPQLVVRTAVEHLEDRRARRLRCNDVRTLGKTHPWVHAVPVLGREQRDAQSQSGAHAGLQ